MYLFRFLRTPLGGGGGGGQQHRRLPWAANTLAPPLQAVGPHCKQWVRHKRSRVLRAGFMHLGLTYAAVSEDLRPGRPLERGTV